jgi:hypothetical protein
MYMACIAIHKWNGHGFLTARLNPVRRGIISLLDFEMGEICQRLVVVATSGCCHDGANFRCIYRSCFGNSQMVRAGYLM